MVQGCVQGTFLRFEKQFLIIVQYLASPILLRTSKAVKTPKYRTVGILFTAVMAKAREVVRDVVSIVVMALR